MKKELVAMARRGRRIIGLHHCTQVGGHKGIAAAILVMARHDVENYPAKLADVSAFLESSWAEALCYYAGVDTRRYREVLGKLIASQSARLAQDGYREGEEVAVFDM